MLFIGTKTEIEQIPYDKSRPGYHVELVAGEFLPVMNVFSTPFIYFVGMIQAVKTRKLILHRRCFRGIKAAHFRPGMLQEIGKFVTFHVPDSYFMMRFYLLFALSFIAL